MYDTVDKVFFGFLAALVAVMIFGIGYLIYAEVVSDKFYLRKDQWACTAAHEETITTFQKVGDVQVPMTTVSTVCDQWSRR